MYMMTPLFFGLLSACSGGKLDLDSAAADASADGGGSADGGATDGTGGATDGTGGGTGGATGGGDSGGGDTAGSGTAAVEGLDDPGRARCEEGLAIDYDPDPSVVEVHLTADEYAWDPGTGTAFEDGYAYNGCVPGPIISARLGDTVRIVFQNDTDMDTTIHWHGLRVPNDMDGTPMVQDPVAPGERFTYEYVLRDVGLYWYHPHLDVDLQVERGLSGAIWVQDPEAPELETSVVVLDDVLRDSSGQIAPTSTSGMGTMGRLGDLLLASGRVDAEIPMSAGTWRLLALVNAANTRYFDLELEGHELLVVGSDGGFFNEPVAAERVLLGPGQRALVLVAGEGEPGGRYALNNYAVDLFDTGGSGGGMGGMGGMMLSDPLGDGPNTVLTLVYDEAEGALPDPPSFPTGTLEAWTPGTPAHTWTFTETMAGGGMAFAIDGELWPDVTPLELSGGVGQVTLAVDNQTSMRHPFHIHGQRFQVVEVNGEPVDQPMWQDTFDVPAEGGITLVTELENPGDWMYHCHILEHEENGMMGDMIVE